MADRHTNAEIEDVLSSIRRLVTEDLRRGGDDAAARPDKAAAPDRTDAPDSTAGSLAGPADTAADRDIPSIEVVPAQVSATVTPLRRAAAPEPARDTEERISAAIDEINATLAGDMPEAAAAEPAADAAPDELEQELTDPADLRGAEAAPVAGAEKFVLTAALRVTEAEAPESEGEPQPAGHTAIAPAAPDADEQPVTAASCERMLDDLVSGEALLASFGAVGPAQEDGGQVWDLEPGAAPLSRNRALRVPLLPASLEETIADLEMAVAARSEDYEPDMADDLPPAQEAAEAADRAEAPALPVQPLVQRGRLHLERSDEAAEAAGHIGIADPFPAEDPWASIDSAFAGDGDDPLGPETPAASPDDLAELPADLAGDDLLPLAEAPDLDEAVEAALLPEAAVPEAAEPAFDADEATEDAPATEDALPSRPRRLSIVRRAEFDAGEPGAAPDPAAATDLDEAVAEALAMPIALHLASEVTAAVTMQTGAAVQQPQDGGEGAGALAGLDGEALRALVADLIRQELQGPLGERITRNVRRMIRREINRSLESRELD